MAIRDWAPRTLWYLWLAAAMVQLAILLPWANQQYRFRHSAPLPPATDSIPGIFTSRDSADRVALLATLRDSLGIVLKVRGDTITGAALTPRGVRQWQPIAEEMHGMLAQVGRTAMPSLIILLLLGLSPTLAVVGLTGYWFWQRGTRGSGVPDV
jgi:hypothetical protein